MRNESEDIQTVERLGEARDKIVTELRKTIVGMNDVIDEMMIAIFARGHCLLVGVPGLARKFEARLYGYLDYDRQKKSFTRFDMLALGETYGGFETGLGHFGYTRPGRAPYGIAFELVGDDASPVERHIPPCGGGATFTWKGYFGTASD